jgi:hypothetical protein
MDVGAEIERLVSGGGGSAAAASADVAGIVRKCDYSEQIE